MSVEAHCSYEVLLDKLGGFGRFQIRTFLTATLIYLVAAFNNLGYMFWAGRPDHWCDVTRPNHLANVTDAQWKQLVVPVSEDGNLDSCNFRDLNLTHWQYDDVIRWLHGDKNMTSFNTNTKACTAWKFDQSQYTSTVVMDVSAFLCIILILVSINYVYVFRLIDESRVRSLLASISFAVSLLSRPRLRSPPVRSHRRQVRHVSRTP